MSVKPAIAAAVPGAASAGAALPELEQALIQQRIDTLYRNTDFAHTLFRDLVGYAIVAADFDGNVIAFNEGARRAFGYTAQEVIGRRRIDQFFAPDFVEDGRLQQAVAAVIGHGQFLYDGDMLRSGAQRFPVHAVLTLTKDMNGNMVGLILIAEDMTERQAAQEKLQLAASVFTHAREGIMITAVDGNIIDVNQAFSCITGYLRDEVLGQNTRILNSGCHGKEFYSAMWRDLIGQGYWNGEVLDRRKSGEVYAEMLTISAVPDAQGNPRQYVALFSDISMLKAHEHNAHYDALTGLPNRVLLADRLHQAMAQAQRRGRPLALAFLDVDRFKPINDQHGHAAGDQLLITIASRMKQVLRAGDTLARVGGDEFVAVLPDLADVAASEPLLTRLLAAAAEPMPFGDKLLQVTASLGVTFYPQAPEVVADQLLRQADLAMYQAKQAGMNRYQVFDAGKAAP